MDEAEDQQAVGARGDADPLVGDGAVAGADRVDRDDAGAAGLELREVDLQGVAVVVLGDAEEQQELGALPVGRAELPEGAAHGVDAGGGHVDRAEAAVRGVVRGAELLRPPAGQRLALVAAGEEGEALGVLLAHRLEPVRRDPERLGPGDLAELAGAARADAAQRPLQAGGREVLHDAGGALGAEHAAVDRVVAVALDVANAGPLHVDVDAAAAGAHVAGGLADRVGGHGGSSRLGRMLREGAGSRKRNIGRVGRRRLAPAEDFRMWLRRVVVFSAAFI